MNTPTPRTDEKTFTGGALGKCEFVDADFARQLEMQLNELRKALEKIANVNYSPMGYGDMQHAIKEARAILEKTK